MGGDERDRPEHALHGLGDHRTHGTRGARHGDEAAAAGLDQFLTTLGTGAIAMANATESGTDVRYPMTEVIHVDGGWRVDGRKIFGTLSPVADVMVVTCRHRRGDGSSPAALQSCSSATPGQTILDNWDALGIRASGSNDVLYDNCVIPDEMFFEESGGANSTKDCS